MDIRALIPHWFTALNMLLWGTALLWYASHPRCENRMLDVGAKIRFIPRLLLALYYACLFFLPDLLGSDVTHFMGRAALNVVALSDEFWVAAEWWIQHRERLGAAYPWMKHLRKIAPIGLMMNWIERKARRV